MPNCLLCLQEKAYISNICSKCLVNLPWNKEFCNQCALPLTPHKTEQDKEYSDICGQCIASPPKFSTTRTAFCYHFPINHLINAFKDRQNIVMGNSLGKLLAHTLMTEANLQNPLQNPLQNSLQNSPPELLIPVPSHQSSIIKRGYNPAEIIAKSLSRSLLIPSSADLVIKLAQSKQQKALTASERFTNLRGAFSLTQQGMSSLPNYYRVAIIDDIVTTGATANALSETLLNAGVQDVIVWAIARTP